MTDCIGQELMVGDFVFVATKNMICIVADKTKNSYMVITPYWNRINFPTMVKGNYSITNVVRYYPSNVTVVKVPIDNMDEKRKQDLLLTKELLDESPQMYLAPARRPKKK